MPALEPAPVSLVSVQQNPSGLAQSPSQMGDRSINGDHLIKLHENGGSVSKIMNAVVEYSHRLLH